MLSELPPVVARFVDASNARDLDRFVACFAADAVVEDEGKTHTGIDEVREWKQETENRHTYTVEPDRPRPAQRTDNPDRHARRRPRQPRRPRVRVHAQRRRNQGADDSRVRVVAGERARR